VTVQGVGSEWISDKNGIPVEFQYKYLARHGWDNYDDQVTYDQDYAQIEYRERTQSCGVNMKTCAGAVQYPVRPKVREIEIKRTRREEPSQMCPYCEYEEYMSTKTNQWAGINGKSKSCVDSPMSAGLKVKTCMGKCIVDQEEYMYENTDYYRATYRWCQNGTDNSPNRLHPDRLVDAYIQTQDMQICKGNLCNDHVYVYGSSRGIMMSLALFVFTLMA